MNTTTRESTDGQNLREPTDGYGFPNTIWSDIDALRSGNDEQRAAALERLLHKYRPPMREFLLRVFHKWRGATPEWLEDCLQSFIERKMMMPGLLEGAEPSSGRFRKLLMTALWRYVATQHRALVRRFKREVPLPEEDEAAGPSASDCLEFEKAWARSIWNEAVRQFESQCRQADQALIWAVFLRRRLFPLEARHTAETLDQTVEYVHHTFGKTLRRQQVSNWQKTAERKMDRCVRDVLADGCANAEDIQEELLSLIQILKGGMSLPTRLHPPSGAANTRNRMNHE